jgi:predicted nucleic acid-binding protein
MTFADISLGSAVFIGAITLIYHFTGHPTFGPAYADLLDLIENNSICGSTSSHVLGEMSHRLLCIEAQQAFGWPAVGISHRIKQHPNLASQLTRYRQAIDEVRLIGVSVLPVDGYHVSQAADITWQFGLLTNDAIIVAVMRASGLTVLTSNDADFDRIPGINRYSPV